MLTPYSSLKRYGQNLQIASSLVYGNYKHTKNLDQTLNLIDASIPILKSQMDVDQNMPIIIRPIKGNFVGLHYGRGKLGGWIEIDPRRADVSFVMETLCHEFVHAEQHYTGRLRKEKGKNYWMDKLHSIGAPKTHSAYLALPWEEEARAREQGLAHAVMESLAYLLGNGSEEKATDPDAELREEVYLALIEEGKPETRARNLANNDTLGQARRLGLI